MADIVVECTEVRKTFRATEGAPEQQVLKGVDLTIRSGERLAIVGPSGCGKSTLLNLIGGLDAPTDGRIAIEGRDIANMGDQELTRLRNERIGFVFQDHHLLPQATVLENVLLPCFARTSKPAREQRDRALELLQRVGLGDRADDWPQNLSGGQRQRVALSRSLVMEPALLLADEPTGALDEATASDMTRLLDEVQQSTGIALLVVTHSRELAEAMGSIRTLTDGVLEAA